MACLKLGGEAEDALEIRSVDSSEVFLPQVSNTFHGRDLFAPAGCMACGRIREFCELGPELTGFQRTNWPEPFNVQRSLEDGVIHCGYLWNAVTAFPASASERRAFRCCSRGGKRFRSNVSMRRYLEAIPLRSSVHPGFVEIAINQGDAAKN